MTPEELESLHPGHFSKCNAAEIDVQQHRLEQRRGKTETGDKKGSPNPLSWISLEQILHQHGPCEQNEIRGRATPAAFRSRLQDGSPPGHKPLRRTTKAQRSRGILGGADIDHQTVGGM